MCQHFCPNATRGDGRKKSVKNYYDIYEWALRDFDRLSFVSLHCAMVFI